MESKNKRLEVFERFNSDSSTTYDVTSSCSSSPLSIDSFMKVDFNDDKDCQYNNDCVRQTVGMEFMEGVSKTSMPTSLKSLITDEGFITDTAVLIKVLASVYEQIIEQNRFSTSGTTMFHAVEAPNISIHDYLQRIKNYFNCSDECLILSIIYIDRVCKSHEGFPICILNIHRVLLTTIMLSAKYFDDIFYSNGYYANVGGVTIKELNMLEVDILYLLDFHLYVSPVEYKEYVKMINTSYKRLQSYHYTRCMRPNQLSRVQVHPTVNNRRYENALMDIKSGSDSAKYLKDLDVVESPCASRSFATDTTPTNLFVPIYPYA